MARRPSRPAPESGEARRNTTLRRYVQDRLSGVVERPDGVAVHGPDARPADAPATTASSADPQVKGSSLTLPGSRTLKDPAGTLTSGPDRRALSCARLGRRLRARWFFLEAPEPGSAGGKEILH